MARSKVNTSGDYSSTSSDGEKFPAPRKRPYRRLTLEETIKTKKGSIANFSDFNPFQSRDSDNAGEEKPEAGKTKSESKNERRKTTEAGSSRSHVLSHPDSPRSEPLVKHSRASLPLSAPAQQKFVPRTASKSSTPTPQKVQTIPTRQKLRATPTPQKGRTSLPLSELAQQEFVFPSPEVASTPLHKPSSIRKSLPVSLTPRAPSTSKQSETPSYDPISQEKPLAKPVLVSPAPKVASTPLQKPSSKPKSLPVDLTPRGLNSEAPSYGTPRQKTNVYPSLPTIFDAVIPAATISSSSTGKKDEQTPHSELHLEDHDSPALNASAHDDYTTQNKSVYEEKIRTQDAALSNEVSEKIENQNLNQLDSASLCAINNHPPHSPVKPEPDVTSVVEPKIESLASPDRPDRRVPAYKSSDVESKAPLSPDVHDSKRVKLSKVAWAPIRTKKNVKKKIHNRLNAPIKRHPQS